MSGLAVEHDGRVAVVLLDQPGEPVNTLTVALGEELVALLARLSGDDTVDAVVLLSGKPDVFIAGADLTQFAALETSEEARTLSCHGQQMVEQIARFPKPLIAAIHGACLGGGLELALAAQYRIASDAPATRLGLPEVRLGLIPAAGGCQRLPRAVGLCAALDMILTGRSVRPGHARRMGVVDEVVPQSILRSVATATAARLASGWRPRRRSRRRVQTLLLDRNPIGRWLICRLAGARVIKRTGGHYPAPLVAIDAIRHGLVRGHEAGLTRESALFGQLAVGVVARHLVQIFFATTALKKDTGGIDFSGARSVERLGIVGAGFMGAGIAGVAVLAAGVDVRLRDTNWDHVARGLAAARHVLGQAVRRRRLDAHERYRRASLLSGAPVPSTAGFRERDLVIEAVFEDVDVKRRTIADLERIVADRCVLASNTSRSPLAGFKTAPVGRSVSWACISSRRWSGCRCSR